MELKLYVFFFLGHFAVIFDNNQTLVMADTMKWRGDGNLWHVVQRNFDLRRWFSKDRTGILFTRPRGQHDIVQPNFTSNTCPTLSFEDNLKDIQWNVSKSIQSCGPSSIDYIKTFRTMLLHRPLCNIYVSSLLRHCFDSCILWTCLLEKRWNNSRTVALPLSRLQWGCLSASPDLCFDSAPKQGRHCCPEAPWVCLHCGPPHGSQRWGKSCPAGPDHWAAASAWLRPLDPPGARSRPCSTQHLRTFEAYKRNVIWTDRKRI